MPSPAPTSTMKVKALAPWFGGKRNLAPWIIAEAGPHASWWELCAASMSVTLAKPRASMETVVDLHGDVMNLARVVRDTAAGSKLYRMLRRTAMTDEVLEAARLSLTASKPPAPDDAPDVARAYWYFLMSWLGRNGSSGTANTSMHFCVRYTRNGGHAATRFRSAVNSIPAWRHRLREVTILQRDLFGVVERIRDDAKTVIYCDPPYLEKGSKYVHDFDGLHHHQLADRLRRFEHCRVLVSYYDHPRLADLYPGWTVVRREVNKALANTGQRSATPTKAVEVLLINGPSLTEAAA